jgi:hypothetical protein
MMDEIIVVVLGIAAAFISIGVLFILDLVTSFKIK